METLLNNAFKVKASFNNMTNFNYKRFYTLCHNYFAIKNQDLGTWEDSNKASMPILNSTAIPTTINSLECFLIFKIIGDEYPLHNFHQCALEDLSRHKNRISLLWIYHKELMKWWAFVQFTEYEICISGSIHIQPVTTCTMQLAHRSIWCISIYNKKANDMYNESIKHPLDSAQHSTN